jgi:hypothetical protein
LKLVKRALTKNTVKAKERKAMDLAQKAFTKKTFARSLSTLVKILSKSIGEGSEFGKIL